MFRLDGSRTFPPRTSPEKNAKNVVEVEAELMKQYLLCRSWIH